MFAEPFYNLNNNYVMRMNKLYVAVLCCLTGMTLTACSKENNDNSNGGGSNTVQDGSIVTGKKMSKMTSVRVTQHWEDGTLVNTDSVVLSLKQMEWDGDRLVSLQSTNSNGEIYSRLEFFYTDGRVTRCVRNHIESNDIDTIDLIYDATGRISGYTNGDRTRTLQYDSEGNITSDNSQLQWQDGNLIAVVDRTQFEYDDKVNYIRCIFPWNYMVACGEKEELSKNNVTKRTRQYEDRDDQITVYHFQYAGDYPIVRSYETEPKKSETKELHYEFFEYTDGIGRK